MDVLDALDVFARWHAAHEAVDPEALAKVLADDVVIHSLFRPAPVVGRDNALAHFQATMAVFPDLSLELLTPPATGDGSSVLAEVRFHGHFTGVWDRAGVRYPPTGAALSVPGVVIVRVRGGLVHEVRTLFDRGLWLSQIGVPQEGA